MRIVYSAMLVSALMTIGAFADDAATTKPAPAGLLGGRIEYLPPGGWNIVKSNLPADAAAVFIAEDHDGCCALQVLPENASIGPSAALKILSQLRINHKKAGQEIVEAPKSEKDPRFAICIHERYKTRDGKIVDETHLYRQVGPRAMELDVQSLSDDQKQIDLVRQAGDELLLSAHWKKPASTKKKAG